jgi:hypothetical protein
MLPVILGKWRIFDSTIQSVASEVSGS